jgi:hypothetical protein
VEADAGAAIAAPRARAAAVRRARASVSDDIEYLMDAFKCREGGRNLSPRIAPGTSRAQSAGEEFGTL